MNGRKVLQRDRRAASIMHCKLTASFWVNFTKRPQTIT